MKRVFLFSLRIYKTVVSPYLPTVCRYYPTCAQYSYEAVENHGVLKGIRLTIKRISRCYPSGGKGYDPVP